jgi:hypothetical protein
MLISSRRLQLANIMASLGADYNIHNVLYSSWVDACRLDLGVTPTIIRLVLS